MYSYSKRIAHKSSLSMHIFLITRVFWNNLMEKS